jgi:hypothetical protein
MHVLAPRPAKPVLPVFLNVDGVVGAAPAQNKLEDVLLVQFYLKFLADHSDQVSSEVIAALRAVQVTGHCDAATIKAIRVTQERFKRRAPGTVVDGRVSPAGDYGYGGGVGVWTIVQFNNIVQENTKEVWPRIDKLRDCPLHWQLP